MKRVIFLLILIVCTITSCQDKIIKTNKSQESHKAIVDSKINKENKSLDFLKYLKNICVEDDGVFKNCDELFTKDGSSLFFIIIPKAGTQKWYDEKSKNLKGEIFEVNNQLIEKVKKSISKEFNIWVFCIDQKYTEYVNMDSSYNLKTPRITDLYFSKGTNWEKLESFKVSNEADDLKENEWRRTYIDKIIAESNSNIQTYTNKISDGWAGKYSVYFSYGKIGEQIAGWSLDLEISNQKIVATGEGYQMGFKDLLTAKETNNNELLLNHAQNLSGYNLGVKMNPEFILIKSDNRYFVKSKWIDSDIVTKAEAKGYLIEKIK